MKAIPTVIVSMRRHQQSIVQDGFLDVDEFMSWLWPESRTSRWGAHLWTVWESMVLDYRWKTMEGETSQFVENHFVSARKFRSTCRTLTNILSSLSLMLCSLLLFPRTHAISGEGFRCEWLLTFDHEVWKWLGLIRVPRWSGGQPQTRFFYPIVEDSMLDWLCYGSTWTYTIHFCVRAPGNYGIHQLPAMHFPRRIRFSDRPYFNRFHHMMCMAFFKL